MAKSWYIIHVYSGYEKKVLSYIDRQLRAKESCAPYIGDVKVPEEDIIEMCNGKRSQTKKKLFPGYILIEMDLPEEHEEWKAVCNALANAPGVTGFIGSQKNQKPRPISNEEMKSILQKMSIPKTGQETMITKMSFNLGDSVKVADGPFQGFNGIIEEINHEKGKIKVKVEIFGRSTPVELNFLQVEKL